MNYRILIRFQPAFLSPSPLVRLAADLGLVEWGHCDVIVKGEASQVWSFTKTGVHTWTEKSIWQPECRYLTLDKPPRGRALLARLAYDPGRFTPLRSAIRQLTGWGRPRNCATFAARIAGVEAYTPDELWERL